MHDEGLRQLLIEDGLVGLVYWLGKPKAILLPLTDLLLLLIDKPAAVSILPQDASRRTFASWTWAGPVSDELRSVASRTGRLPGELGFISAETISTGGELIPDEGATRLACGVMRGALSNYGDASRRLEELLRSALESVTITTEEGLQEPLPRMVMKKEYAMSLLNPMRPVIAQAFGLIPDSASLQDKHLPSASVLAAFPLQGPRGDRSRIVHLVRNDESGDDLMQPKSAGRDARHNAHLVGVLSLEEQERQVGEVSRRRSPDKGGPTDVGHRLLTPVHVGGVPWVVLDHQIALGKRNAWIAKYHLYRSVLPRLATTIRVGARNAYLGQVSAAVLDGLRSASGSADFLATINNRMEQLGMVYPFHGISLSPWTSDASGEQLALPGGLTVSIDFQRSAFRPTLEYDPLSPDEVLRTCRSAVHEYMQIETRLQLRAVAESTHMLRTPLGALEADVVDVKDKGLRDSLERRIHHLQALERFSRWLFWPDRTTVGGPRFVTCGLNDFVLIVQRVLRELLEILANPRHSRDTSAVLAALPKPHRLEEVLIDSFDEDGDWPVQYCELHVQVVLDGLLTNALKYIDHTKPRLQLSCQCVKYEGKRTLALTIANSVGRSSAGARSLADSLNTQSSLSGVGISLLHQACLACGFAPPVWEAQNQGSPGIAVTVQLARILPRR